MQLVSRSVASSKTHSLCFFPHCSHLSLSCYHPFHLLTSLFPLFLVLADCSEQAIIVESSGSSSSASDDKVALGVGLGVGLGGGLILIAIAIVVVKKRSGLVERVAGHNAAMKQVRRKELGWLNVLFAHSYNRQEDNTGSVLK